MYVSTNLNMFALHSWPMIMSSEDCFGYVQLLWYHTSIFKVFAGDSWHSHLLANLAVELTLSVYNELGLL